LNISAIALQPFTPFSAEVSIVAGVFSFTAGVVAAIGSLTVSPFAFIFDQYAAGLSAIPGSPHVKFLDVDGIAGEPTPTYPQEAP
jgi:hypothetical protein